MITALRNDHIISRTADADETVDIQFELARNHNGQLIGFRRVGGYVAIHRRIDHKHVTKGTDDVPTEPRRFENCLLGHAKLLFLR